MKLWISSKDAPPDFDWDWVTTSEAAIALLNMFNKLPTDEPYESIAYGDLSGDDTCENIPGWLSDAGIEFNEVWVTALSNRQREKILNALR